MLVLNKIKTYKLFFINNILLFTLLFACSAFARPNTLCNGKEFNRRVKTLVDGGEVAVDYKIFRFERGNNPPSDSSYYIDVSEDNDESVIVYYIRDNINSKKKDKEYNLYWYATDTIFMNENAAFMFQGFVNIKYIDLTGFSYFEGLDDTRYMFKDCRNLKNLQLKPTAYNPAEGKGFTPTEVQGMFYGCQSLREINLTQFNTYLVSNMSDMFCKCYNLRDIYVDKTNWNIENVYNFNRMFSDCHLLRTNKGKKAVDIADDEYEKYAAIGTADVESFIKDTNGEYTSYVSDDAYVPIDGQGYLMDVPAETFEDYGDEPEYDGDGTGGAPNNAGFSTNETGAMQMLQADTNTNQTQANANTQTSNNSTIATEKQTINESITQNNNNLQETQQSNASLIDSEQPNTNDADAIESSKNIEEGSSKKIVEINEYLAGEGKKNAKDRNVIEVLIDDYQPLLITLLISIFVLLLLIGMVFYLYKEKRNSSDKDKI